METFKANDETMNALVNGLGAVVMALAQRMPLAQREAFANDLAQLARSAEARGALNEETLLLDLYRAAKP